MTAFAPPPSSACAAPPAASEAWAVVRENARVADGLWRMRLEAPALAGRFAPGQFFQLRVSGPGGGGPFLRRPFSPCGLLPDGLAFVYAVRGVGTRAMTAFAPGHRASLLGPLGRGYAPPEGPGGAAALVGGGCGLPSLYPLAEALSRQGRPFFAVAGAATAGALPEAARWAALGPFRTATDDGSAGRRGTAFDVLQDWLREPGGPGSLRPALYACGPAGLLAAVAGLALDRGLACQVSLEERMACGFGACMGCAVPVRDPDRPGGMRYARACHDGPVFRAGEVLFAEGPAGGTPADPRRAP